MNNERIWELRRIKGEYKCVYKVGHSGESEMSIYNQAGKHGLKISPVINCKYRVNMKIWIYTNIKNKYD